MKQPRVPSQAVTLPVLSTWGQVSFFVPTFSPASLNQVTRPRLLQPADGLVTVKCPKQAASLPGHSGHGICGVKLICDVCGHRLVVEHWGLVFAREPQAQPVRAQLPRLGGRRLALARWPVLSGLTGLSDNTWDTVEGVDVELSVPGWRLNHVARRVHNLPERSHTPSQISQPTATVKAIKP